MSQSRSADAGQQASPKRTAEGRRIALVVGNSRYVSSPLTNPENDAELIATTLRSLGFEVRLQKNGDQTGMKRAIQEFGATLEKAGADAVGLFYYAGHGVQLGGRNYLIPVGAKIDRDADVDIEAVSADWVLEQMRYARNRLNFVILDACRNNPFARSFRSADRGLAKMDAPAGVLIAYSTAPGDVAADGAGSNSPYSEALARAMRESADPAELMFKQARDAVRQMTTDRQTPWESSSLTGRNFYFAATDDPAAMPVSSVAPVVVSAVSPSAAAVAASAVNRDEAVDVFSASTPWFMAEPLCRSVVGQWKLDDDTIPGYVRLDGKATGQAKVKNHAELVPVKWECDAGRRDYVITYEGLGIVHKVRIDGAEKLMFGYDQNDKPLTYTR